MNHFAFYQWIILSAAPAVRRKRRKQVTMRRERRRSGRKSATMRKKRWKRRGKKPVTMRRESRYGVREMISLVPRLTFLLTHTVAWLRWGGGGEGGTGIVLVSSSDRPPRSVEGEVWDLGTSLASFVT